MTLDLITEIASDVFLVDGPGGYLWRLPVPARCIIVRLPDGGLWVYAPCALNEAVCQALSHLGRPAHLVVPNRRGLHTVNDWVADWPDLILHGATDVLELARMAGVSGDWQELKGQGAWQPDLIHCAVNDAWGGPESLFLHTPSKSLIIGDLIINLPTAEMPLWIRPLIWLAGIDDSDGKMPYTLRRYDHRKLGDDIEQLLGWDFERILLVHGNCYHQNGKAELGRAFRRMLRRRARDRLLYPDKGTGPTEGG